MKLQYAALLALLITLLFYVNFTYNPLLSPPSSRERVEIEKVVDGDTFKTTSGLTIRLINVNTPEKTEAGYKEAKAYVQRFENSSVEIEITGTDKYKRTLARVYTPDYLNLLLVKEGLARPFLVDDSEVKSFYDAQENAVNAQKGAWTHSPFYGCFSSKLNPKEEYAVLSNTCQTISISGWYVRDESRKTYKFKNISLGTITLHSLKGDDTNQDLFWNSDQHIWNDDRDTLYLFDDKDNIVYVKSFGQI